MKRDTQSWPMGFLHIEKSKQTNWGDPIATSNDLFLIEYLIEISAAVTFNKNKSSEQ